MYQLVMQWYALFMGDICKLNQELALISCDFAGKRINRGLKELIFSWLSHKPKDSLS
jgi:hypothetical protein